ncbi:hypothetical protein K458DRAFT_296332 [Lentithecium fluviatile CBS 122367]|uniref:Uncharacterized protein n=1 Tax=Lentithecium fluviatile CBS 122367 TaxID=1168545 RepID=A0A6G1JAB4_9PLEO|nr:hypothetical protein K458DRAFT_296332 [Lentithecium fluviatile CBS 122367]
MNRFLTRKKDKKKTQPEPKPELNIAAALPKADDFRTSLIMPGLSTRFSMLREQDDPSSKIGKASDDSVLQPKRQSRLHEFGFVPGGLSDIAEVSSLNGSVRPPLGNERQNSYDSSAEDGGSMMSRARPGEGNVLFGGRQKVYKISGAGNSKGRLLYDDDVHLSTFQKLRQQERERLAQEAEQAGDTQEPPSPVKDAYSPVTDGFSRRRETSSSTNSGSNARISTAATSIASQGGNSIPAAPVSPTEITRSTTKARRLYDQGLDQQMYEQQSSAMHRLNSIQRTRAPTGRSTPPLMFSQTRSATNLSDRFNRGTPSRTDSPTPSAHSGVANGRDAQSNASSPVLSRGQSPPPLSPLASDSELTTAVQYQDRGKATAMGAFNKPKHAFSEEQYAERLKQLQSERDAPVPKLDNPRKPSLRERAEIERRKRAEAGATGRERSGSSTEQKQAPSPFSVFQSAANQMKSPTMPVHPLQKQSEPSPKSVQSPDLQGAQTFFVSPGSSDDEQDAPQPIVSKAPSERGRRMDNLPVATGPAPPILDHPALRSRSNSRLAADRFDHSALRSRSNSRPEPRSSPIAENTVKPNDPDVDSPTLGPNNGGLSGLIRQHLRNVSNVSSNYDDNRQSMMSTSPPQTQPYGFQMRQPGSETDTLATSSYSHSNPWDLDDIEGNPYAAERGSVSSVSPVDAPKSKTQPPTLSSPSSSGTERGEDPMHQRGRSVEEHEAFQRDLAQRQRAIQESLRARAEGRSTSPAPAPSSGLKTALNMLRAKSSRESFATVESQKPQDAPSKAMKMLGLGINSNASSPSLASDRWGSDGPSLRQKPMRVLQQSERDAQREMGETRQRSEESHRDTRPKGRSPPASSRSSTRDRSSSELSSGRSRSRGGRYRDDLEQAMAEGVSSRSTVFPPNPSASFTGYVANPTQPLPSERPSIDSEGRKRSRSNSRTTAANHFESKHLQPINTGNGPMNGPPRLSPAGNGSNVRPPQFSPGLPVSPRPSPGGPSPSFNAFRPQGSPIPPISAANTPPVSNPGTPVAPAFNPNAAPPPMAKAGPLRKKSIAKSEISDPVFISTTSVIDTINLPAGASLKNGMDSAPPPVPPINPMRRRFTSGRKDIQDPAIHAGLGSPTLPFAEPARTNSSDAISSQTTLPKPRLRETASEGKSLRGVAQASAGASPAMPSGVFGRKQSPPRPINQHHFAQKNMNGAMF